MFLLQLREVRFHANFEEISFTAGPLTPSRHLLSVSTRESLGGGLSLVSTLQGVGPQESHRVRSPGVNQPGDESCFRHRSV